MATCRACEKGELQRFLSLGDIPPVNAFIPKERIPQEKAYPLDLAYCSECLLVQLMEIVPPEELFSNYLHLSAGSATNVNHLREVADMLKEKLALTEETKVLEIGSNDGTLLEFIKDYTPHVLGVDPAKNLVAENEKRGVEMIPEFFNTTTAKEIRESHGTYDVIIGLNVIPHTPDVVDLLKASHDTLSEKGTLIMEGVYALETILRGEFDTIYHEHVYTFSLHALINTFALGGLRVVDVEHIPTQGGSLRIFAAREEDDVPVQGSVTALLAKEQAKGLADKHIYDQVESKAVAFKEKFMALVKEQKPLIGIGAPARGVVIMNYCGITPEDVDVIVDDTPLKQGNVAPGVHIPVTNWEVVTPERNTFLLLCWNYKEHLLQKLRERGAKGTVIIPFPELHVEQL